MLRVYVLFISFCLSVFNLDASDELLAWDNPDAATGLRIHYDSDLISVRETRADDLAFYKSILTNPAVVQTMGSGRIVPDDVIESGTGRWTTAFADGVPRGRMVVECEGVSAGFVHLVPTGESGEGEVIRALLPDFQGGRGTAMLRFLVEVWAPAVNQIGENGREGYPKDPYTTKFSCFGDEPLRTIYTTSRPDNSRSWGSYKRFDFKPTLGDAEPAFYVEGDDPVTSLDGLGLTPDQRYQITWPDGEVKTVSYVSKYKGYRFHFARPVHLV